MNIINKKIKVVLVFMLLIIEGMSIFLMYKTINNKEIILDDVKLKDIKNNSNVAIMIEQDDGTYLESESSIWPTDMSFNTNKSGCIDNLGNKIENALTYDEISNLVIADIGVTSNCYIYFDLLKDDITIAVATDGVSNLTPTGNKYKTELECSKSNSMYSNRYQRIELSNLSNSGIKCNLEYTNDTNTYTLLKDEVEAKATSGVDGYRYQGKEPDNWVWFNNEMWRIIGSIPTCTDATIDDSTSSGTCNQTEDTKPRLVKIIRANPIGGLAYHHSTGSYTIWGSNTLYTLLNEYYYGKRNATGASPCFLNDTTDYALCNYERIGISSDSIDSYGKMVKSVYMNSGTVSSTSTKIDAAYNLEVAIVSKLTKIGLMSISDYGYATSGITYSSVELLSLSSYTKTNWLYGQGYEWTMTPYSVDELLFLEFAGSAKYSERKYTHQIDSGLTIRPVLYLDSSIYIIEGTGIKTDPYIIGM